MKIKYTDPITCSECKRNKDELVDKLRKARYDFHFARSHDEVWRLYREINQLAQKIHDEAEAELVDKLAPPERTAA